MKENLIYKYRARAEKFAQQYQEEVSQHIIEVMASVMMTRDNILLGGGFTQAIVKNDLYGAISRADSECQKNLRIIVLAFEYAHLNN